MATIQGTIVYSNLQNPVENFNKDGYEYTVQLVVSEKVAKAFKRKFKKQAPREVPTSEFTEIFKCEVPFPDQEDQYIIKMKQATEYLDKKTNKKVPITERMRIRALLNTGRKNSSGKPILEDITDEKLIGNGSVGVIMFREASNKFGTFAQPQAIRVDELVEYSVGYDELGEIEGGVSFEDTEADDDSDEIPWDQESSSDDSDDNEEDLY